MINVIDGDLWRWDIGRKIKVIIKDDFIVNEIHFCNTKSDTALIHKVNHSNEMTFNIPNILLQSEEDLIVYLVHIDEDLQQTFRRKIFKIHNRIKPSDYVYIDTEVFTYKTLEQEIEKIKNYTVDESKIKQAVDEYLSENPVEIPEVEIPKNVSHFKNDAGYLTKIPDEYVTEKELDNKGFALKEDIPKIPEIPDAPVQSVNGQTGDVKLDAESVGALPKNTKIPVNTSDLDNDAGFITKTVNDLTNYYLKSETYTQEQVNQLLSSIPKFLIQPVDSLPTTDISVTTIYLLKSGDETDNLYTEYIYVNGAWEYLGKQTVDLSGYALSTDIPTKVSELVNDVMFITNTVSDLVYYYKKNEVYNKDEIDNKRFLTEHHLDGYATESYVKDYAQPKGNYLTEHQSLEEYAKKDEIPNVPSWALHKTKPQYSASEVGADSIGSATQALTDAKSHTNEVIGQHNVSTDAHNDLRVLLKELSDKINHFLDIDDETKDQASEIVKLIEDNRDVIEQITTDKVNVTDIIDNLTTNLSNKALSASMGVELKRLVDAIKVPSNVSELQNDAGYLTEHQDITGKLDANKLPEAINTALYQAKVSGEFNGKDGVSGVYYGITEPNDPIHPIWINPDGGSSIQSLIDAVLQEASGVPLAYKVLNYIETTGTQYIDTGYKHNQNTRVIMDAETTSEHSEHVWLFEGRVASGDSPKGIFLLSGKTWSADYNTSNKRVNFPDIPAIARLKIDFNKNILKINDITHEFEASTFQSKANLYLLACNTNGEVSGFVTGRLYMCQIYDNDKLIRDYIPVMHKVSGVVGLYDRANSVFYTNSGTGNFVQSVGW